MAVMYAYSVESMSEFIHSRDSYEAVFESLNYHVSTARIINDTNHDHTNHKHITGQESLIQTNIYY